MSDRLYILISAVVGIITGFITIHSFFANSWTSMILWVVVGLVLLYFSKKRRTAIYSGAVFGFFNIATWLASGFQGATAQLVGFLILAIVLSIVGAVCGSVGALLFYWLFRHPAESSKLRTRYAFSDAPEESTTPGPAPEENAS